MFTVQAKGASSEEVNLRHMVPCEPAAEDKAKELPEWSEKVAQNILSGTIALPPSPGSRGPARSAGEGRILYLVLNDPCTDI